MTYQLIHGDCLDAMRTLSDCSVDSVVTDPPYGLSFMGKDWDHGVPGVAFWTEALRVAKPGAMLLAFGGTRTYHRLTCAIEDAGWEIRDCIMYAFGSGFPKSANVSKLIDKAAGAEQMPTGEYKRASIQRNGTGETWKAGAFASHPEETKRVPITAPATPDAATWDGWGSALKPAYEPIVVAMKPLDGTYANNALTWGVAGLWIDGARVPITDGATMARNNKPGDNGWKNSSGGPNSAALNGEPTGRWPSNLILDGSDEVMACFPVTTSGGGLKSKAGKNISGQWRQWEKRSDQHVYTKDLSYAGDTGSAARFFATCPPDEGDEFTRLYYTAKASKRERNQGLEGMEAKIYNDGRDEDLDSGRFPANRGNEPKVNGHPTVKSLSLMRYLVRLTRTPTGGVVLDPFMGSGTTGAACMYEGRDFIGIDLEPEYVEIARRRIEYHAQEATKAQPALLAQPEPTTTPKPQATQSSLGL